MSRRLFVLVAAALGLAGCAYLGGRITPYRPPASYPAPPEALAGAELGGYLYGRDCASCHGSQGQGTARGPDLRTGANGAALTDFMLRTGRMPIADERQPTRRGDPVYDEEAIAAVVEFIVSEFEPPGPGIPAIDPAAGDVATGQELYQLNCAACHATTGIGGAMLTQRGQETVGGTPGVIVPDLGESSLREVAEAVRTGPGTMPVFGRGVVSDEELDSLLRYVALLQDPPDPGGAGIGHVGPFSEGAVGWLLGLGSLIAFLYWLGSKLRGEP